MYSRMTSSPLFREGLRDVHFNRLQVRERDVRHHRHTLPRSGNVMRDCRATNELLLRPWPASRVGCPARGSVSRFQARP